MERRELREVRLDEINAELQHSGVILVNRCQVETDLDAINWSVPVEDQLFSKELERSFTRERLIGLLALNTSIYSDETEEAISHDPVVERILSSKAEDRVNEDRYALALRARRSVVAFLFEYAKTTQLSNLPGGSENNHTTAA